MLLASASNAIIIGFNVRPDRNAAEIAEREEVDIRQHTVIYNVTDEMKKAMTGLLDPTFKEVRLGSAEVREHLQGAEVRHDRRAAWSLDGRITRSGDTRRACCATTSSIHEGKIWSLRRFKDDVSEVKSGFECGIGLRQATTTSRSAT